MLIYIVLLVLLYCISKTYVSTTLSLVIVASTFILCHCIFLYLRQRHREQVKRVDINTIYHNLQHGDIIFTSCSASTLPLEHLLLPVNNGTSHMAVVIEEDGEKYFVHGYAGDKDKYTHQADYVFPYLHKIPFKLLKEPLMAMILSSLPLYYQVFRTNNKKLRFSKQYQLPNYFIRYCTMSIAQILIDADIIPINKAILFPYQPEYIIHYLTKKKYPCFYMMDDRIVD